LSLQPSQSLRGAVAQPAFPNARKAAASRSDVPAGKAWLAAPLLAFFLLFVGLPIVMLVVTSLTVDGGFGLANFQRLVDDGLSLSVLARTLRLGAESSALALILGYPLALLFVAAPRRLQKALVLLIVLPLLTSAVVRTFAWVVILGRQGLVNETLIGLGAISKPASLLYTEPMLVMALAQIELPIATLPIISALSAINPRLYEASSELGAGRWATLFNVTIPLSLHGVVAGLLLVFAASCGALVTQSIIGGGRLLFAPLYIYQQGMQAQNWPFAAAVSIVLLASVLAVAATLNAFGRLTTRRLHV
jgi:putative spermidine/putrescine transport system permease protein